MRTNLDINDPLLRDLKQHQTKEDKSLDRLVITPWTDDHTGIDSL